MALLVIGRGIVSLSIISRRRHTHDIIPPRGHGWADWLLVNRDSADRSHAAMTSQSSVRDSSSQSASQRDKRWAQ